MKIVQKLFPQTVSAKVHMTLYSWIAILTIVGISSTTFSLAKQPTSAINQPTVTGTMMKNGIEVACSGDPYCEAQPYIGKYIHMFKSLMGIKKPETFHS